MRSPSHTATNAVVVAGLTLVWLLSVPPARAGQPAPDRAPVVASPRALAATPDPAPGAVVTPRVPAPATVAALVVSGATPAESTKASGPTGTPRSPTRPHPAVRHHSRARPVSKPGVYETPTVRATVSALTAALDPISRLTRATSWAAPTPRPGWALLAGAVLALALSGASLATLRIVVRLGRG